MKLYLIRHGETDYNVKHILNDNPKNIVPLNDKGIRQAKLAAKKLENKKIEIIYSSPFVRTTQTSKIINEHLGLMIRYDDRICERKFGMDSKPAKDLTLIYKKEDIFTWKPKDGESFQEEKHRTTSFLDELKKIKHKNVLIVSHEQPLQTMLIYLLRLSDKQAIRRRIGNCEIIETELK